MARYIFALAVAAALSGCASPRGPLFGVVYTDFDSGVLATSVQAGNRVGKACMSSILGLVATGDATIETARRNGGITLISAVDEKSYGILGVYSTYCVVVRGR